MNIGVMQLANINVSPSINLAQQSTSSTKVNQSNKFGEVFNNIVSFSAVQNSNEKAQVALDANADFKEVLNAGSVEEVLDLLDIPYEQGLLMLQVGEEGKVIGTDELMDLHSLLAVLNIEQDELANIVSKLLDEKELEITNIGQFIELMNEQATKLAGELTSALQGEGNVSPKEAQALLQFLKLTQLASKESDLVNHQVEQLMQLKELLETVVSALQSKGEQKQPSIFERIQTELKISLQGNEQVVTKTETTEVQNMTTNPTQQTATKTITITLPNANQAKQSEALLKEFQNLLNRSQIGTTQGTTKLLLKLYPENLGAIRIEVMQKDGMLSARLLASTPIGKELLDSQIHQLRSAFAQANIQMERIDIAQSLQEADLHKEQSLFSNLFNQQQHEEEQETNAEESSDKEKLIFKDFLVNEEV